MLSVLLIGFATQAGSPSIQTISGWGNVIDPDGDCAITAGDGKVMVEVPGRTHDLSSYHSIYKKRNAPRILQEIEGDFTVQVKVTGTFDPGAHSTLPEADPFNGAGLLLWADNENFLRLERNVWTTPDGGHSSYQPLFEYWKNNTDLTPGTPSSTPFFTGSSTCLRLTRQGNQVRAAVSSDGVNWIETDPVTVQFPAKINVGVDAINTSKQPFSVEFTEFKLTANQTASK
jgi:regulation of enolase protein 1 (concanavalin A-like superfamily)